MLVPDSSAIVAVLVDAGPEGTWARRALDSAPLVAPHHLPAEAANVLRRLEARGEISPDVADAALADLLDLPAELVPFAPFAHRVWELRGAITAYDSWYVALAESLGAPLLTLDRRLARAPGVRCDVQAPD